MAKAGTAYNKPSDIDESKYVVPKSQLGKFIEDNHVIAKGLGGLVGFGTNLIVPFSGAVTGSAATYGLQQLGLGKRHRTSGKAPQHGSGATVFRTSSFPVNLKNAKLNNMHQIQRPMMGGNSPFLLTTNSSFNSVKF